MEDKKRAGLEACFIEHTPGSPPTDGLDYLALEIQLQSKLNLPRC